MKNSLILLMALILLYQKFSSDSRISNNSCIKFWKYHNTQTQMVYIRKVGAFFLTQFFMSFLIVRSVLLQVSASNNWNKSFRLALATQVAWGFFKMWIPRRLWNKDCQKLVNKTIQRTVDFLSNGLSEIFDFEGLKRARNNIFLSTTTANYGYSLILLMALIYFTKS